MFNLGTVSLLVCVVCVRPFRCQPRQYLAELAFSWPVAQYENGLRVDTVLCEKIVEFPCCAVLLVHTTITLHFARLRH